MINILPGMAVMLQERVHGLFPAPQGTAVESTIINFISWLILGIEVIGAVIVVVGIALAAKEFAKVLLAGSPTNYNRIRLLLAKYLGLALEFLLASDILLTAISPTWEQIGKLAAVAVIRTALNFFLSREMEQERRLTREPDGTQAGDMRSAS